MRILIQDRASKKFISGKNCWSASLNDAENFVSFPHAQYVLTTEAIRNANIFLYDSANDRLAALPLKRGAGWVSADAISHPQVNHREPVRRLLANVFAQPNG